MTNNVNLAIVGAGLIGRLLAYKLSKLNYKVTLYEANNLTNNANSQSLSAAAFTAAGMIAPISEAIEADIETFHLGKTSLSLWPNIINQLQAETTLKIDYQHRGSLIISHSQDMAELNHFKRQVDVLSKKCDVSYRLLTTSDIYTLEPDISNHFSSGLFLNDEADIDNRQLMKALLIQLQKQSVILKDNQTVEIKNNTVVSKNDNTQFDFVFDCRGTGAKNSLDNLRGVRGEVLRVSCPDVRISRPIRLMHPRYQIYLVPKPNQQFVIGATQIESEDTSPISVQSMLELCSALYSINPAFSEARIIEQNTNLRPAFNDNNARILINDKNITINGLFRHGYLIAPAIVDTVIDWLNGKENMHFSSLVTH